MGKEPAETDPVKTSNKYAGLETEERDEAEPSTVAAQPENNAAAKVAQVEEITYPIHIQGEAYRSAINAVSTREEVEQPVPKNADPATPLDGRIEDEDDDVDEVVMETLPLGEENLGQDIDPAEFPPLPEANSSRKGRKKKAAEGLNPATQGLGRPPKDIRTRKPKGKDDDIPARRGRSLGRDDLSWAAREHSRSNSREPVRTDAATSSSDADTMEPTLPLDAQVVSRRLILSRTGPAPSQ